MNLGRVEGVLPVVPTPFDENGNIDLRSLERVVDDAVRQRAAALVYPGVASEDVLLSAEERAACIATVLRTADGRVPVVAGVNADRPEAMVTYAAALAEQGVSAVMAMAIPAMNGDTEMWLSQVAAALAGKPIILQNLGAPRGADLSPAQMRALAAKVPAIRYVKEETIPSGQRVSALVEGIGHEFDAVIGGGGARFVFEELDRGATATMPAIELLDLHVDLVKAFLAGDRVRALDLYEASLPLLLLQATYRMRLTKLILKQRGLIACDAVREKLPPLDDKHKSLILEYYERARERAGL